MQALRKSFLTAAVVLVSAGLWGQEAFHAQDPDLLARLSYDRSARMCGRFASRSRAREIIELRDR